MSRWEDELEALGVAPDQALAVLRAAAAAGLTADDLLQALRLASQPAPAISRGLTAAEAAFLARHGGVGADDMVTSTARAHRVAGALDVVRDALTVEQAAALLGVAPDAVAQGVHGGDLYGVPAGHRLLLPRWQFSAGSPLPHLARVLAALPANAHPLTVAGFMTLPSDELAGATPARWLVDGGSPELVIFAMTSLDNW